MFLKKDDCLVCAIQTYNISLYFQPISGNCKHCHPGKYSVKPHFSTNLPLLWINSIVQLTLLLSVLSNFYPMFQECGVDNTKCIFIINDTVFELTGILMMLLIIVQINSRLRELNGWIDIIENRKYFDRIAPFTITRKLILRTIIFNFVIHFFMGLLLAWLLYQSKLDFTLIRTITNFASCYIQNTIGFQCVQKRKISQNINANIQLNLEMHMEGSFDRPRRNLEGFLKRTRRLVIGRKYTFDQLNSFMGPGILVWIIGSVISLIFSIFLQIGRNYDDRQENYEITFMQYRTYGTLIGVIMLLFVLDTKAMNEEILPYLFKYPISKLKPAEATQVEMLIVTLSTHKPVLKTSDIYTNGSKLIASISGTVLTYVLVALQFHASWNK